jgi:hypothetical protein
MGKSFGVGSPETTPPDTSGKKSKSESFYLNPPGRCAQCSHFLADQSDCELVDSQSPGMDEGVIDPQGYCCLFDGGEGSQDPDSPTSPKEKSGGVALMEPESSYPEWEEVEEKERVAA